MAADLTIYCLQQVTDYFEFERLCHDIMLLEEYAKLEPLGGFSDAGRDAIHVDKTSKETTIFAYSVREDWNVKLKEDAAKIHKNGHSCQHLVFITTQNVTARGGYLAHPPSNFQFHYLNPHSSNDGVTPWCLLFLSTNVIIMNKNQSSIESVNLYWTD